MPAEPTIASLLTPPGRGGIAVISLRGPRTGDILRQVFRPLPSHAQAGPSRLQLGRIMDGERGLDEAVVRTDDDSAEINIHGGPAVARAVLATLLVRGATIADGAAPLHAELPPAHPQWNNPAIGEELLAALPLAHSELVVAALTSQWSAGVSQLAHTLFHSPLDAQDAAERREAADRLLHAADGLTAMRKLLEPAEVVLAGEPNAGKSTLANVLVGRGVSLVHDAPGTTRDWVRELALVNGVPVWITDTAGIWPGERPLPPVEESSPADSASTPPKADAAPSPKGTSSQTDQIERQSAARACHRIAGADLVVLLCEPCGPLPAWLPEKNVLRVWPKADQRATTASLCAARYEGGISFSAVTGEGMDRLRGEIVRRLGLAGFDPATSCAFTERQAALLSAAAEACAAGPAAIAAECIRKLMMG